MGRVILFVLLLIIVYGGRSLTVGADEEYQVVVVGSHDELVTRLNALRADRWDVVGFSAQEPGKFVALLKRSKVV
jgi:hypothetical protein